MSKDKRILEAEVCWEATKSIWNKFHPLEGRRELSSAFHCCWCRKRAEMQTVSWEPFLADAEVLSPATSNCRPSGLLCFEARPSITSLPPFPLSSGSSLSVKHSICKERRTEPSNCPLAYVLPLSLQEATNPSEGGHRIYWHSHFGQKMPVHKATFGAEVEPGAGVGSTLKCGGPHTVLLPGTHAGDRPVLGLLGPYSPALLSSVPC